MTRSIIYTNHAPNPIGPYSQAVMVGNTLYASGQIAINPETNQVVDSGIADETQQVMNNIKAILEAAGMNFSNIAKTSIFLKDLGNFDTVNTIYGAHFEANFPARETIEVSRLPKNVNVEISIIAVND